MSKNSEVHQVQVADHAAGAGRRSRSAAPRRRRPAARAADAGRRGQAERRAAARRRPGRPRRARSGRRRGSARRARGRRPGPPANPPPGALWPANSRYTEKTIIVWKSSRTMTSKMIDRRWGASVRRPAATPGRATRSTAPLVAVGHSAASPPSPPARSAAIGSRPPRPRSAASRAVDRAAAARRRGWRRPVAATTSTEISPRVSQARMSTRVTLTMFLPPPKLVAPPRRSPAETGRWHAARPARRARPGATVSADGQRRAASAHPAAGGERPVGEVRGEPAQDQHEHDQRDRLDQHLGEREVGGAVQQEQHADAVAADAEQDDRLEPPARAGDQQRGDDHAGREHQPAPGCPSTRDLRRERGAAPAAAHADARTTNTTRISPR